MSQGFASAAAGLFRYLNEEGVEYCTLGDLRGYPASVDREVSIVVTPATHRDLHQLLKTCCDRNHFMLVERPRLPQRISCFLLGWLNQSERPEFLSLCVRDDYYRFGRRLWSASELLAERAPTPGLTQEIFAPPPAKEFLRALLQCIDRNELTDRDAEHLALQWRLDPEGAAKQVARFWDVGREGGIVLRAAVSGHWEPVRSARNALHSALGFRNVPSPLNWFVEVRRRALRWRRPHGMLIACLGPDATCKIDVIGALAAAPIAPFYRGQIMKFRPEVMRPSSATPVRPKRPVRGRFGTTAKLMLFAADYWLGYWLRIRPSLVRTTLLVSDQYFDDVLVNPERHRMRSPRAFAKLLSRWIPQPALWLVFDAPGASLNATPEAIADIDRMRGEYRRVLRGRRDVVVLDATQSLDDVIAQAERAIAARAARQTSSRLGLPMEKVDNPPAAKMLIFFSRRNVPLLSRIIRAVFNSEIGCRIPPDLRLPHPYGVVIHPQAVIGRRVTLMHQATIGGKDAAHNVAPVIGDDVYVAAGARILGDVRIGDRAVIGANAVVTRDVPAGAIVVGANRILTGRLALASRREADGTIARFPVKAQRGANR